MLGRVLSGRYQLERMLGRGGMGEVWAAQDRLLERRVAVKIIHEHAASEETQELFFREARTAGALTHPGVVTVYDLGRAEDNSVFLVMELVTGRDLRSVLRQDQPLTVEQAVEWTALAADALAATHEAGVVHRDLKPDNLMLTSTGSVKILDFGIARYVSAATLASRVIGTPAYMPPERLAGKAGDGRGDLYSLGCVLYELLTGQPPFGSANFAQVVYAHVQEVPDPPSSHRAGIPPALDALVAELLAKTPGERPSTAAEVRDRLRRVLSQSAGPTTRQQTRTEPPPATEPPGTGDLTRLAAEAAAATGAENWDEAATRYAELARRSAAIRGTDHPETVGARHNHAWSLGNTGQHAQAVPLLTQAVKDLARVHGPDHPDALKARHNLAWNLGNCGYHAEAVAEYEAFSSAYIRVLGSDHQDSLRARHNRAWNIGKTGDHTRAALLLEQVVQDAARVLGAGHPDCRKARHDLAWNLSESGDYTGAARHYRVVLDAGIRAIGADHPQMLDARHGLAWCIGKSGGHAEAADQLTGVVRDSDRVLGLEHRETLRAHHNLAWNLSMCGRHREAADAYDAFIDAYIRVLGPDDPYARDALSEQAWNLERLPWTLRRRR
ncbi:Serine/threonine-protein kinase PknD [Streptomyces sp. RB5]|uniref:non-specific serine/threonine protein kinase n=1 Tax=Streptomyces smaragdinus TaxID=2585196 RepID=A0A7K0CGK2_9ACTN|nr:serine/threonine-protein kinase [Streptomyces smaragdinus]MQY12597.1 Serine/threonine-protein kinase PknD [Streptomyces smaragdinus]